MSDLLDRYPLTAGTYHELLDDKGGVRAHWRRLFDHLQRSTPGQLRQRQTLLARQIQENGVTYNVYADPKGADRPWELDLLPHVIAADEWQQLSAGIAQSRRTLSVTLNWVSPSLRSLQPTRSSAAQPAKSSIVLTPSSPSATSI